MPCRFKQGEGKGVFPLMAQGQVQGELLGKGGGGAVLTEEGAQLLARYDELCRRMQAYGRRQFEELFGEE